MLLRFITCSDYAKVENFLIESLPSKLKFMRKVRNILSCVVNQRFSRRFQEINNQIFKEYQGQVILR